MNSMTKAILHIAGGLKLDDHCSPFQPRPFYDSMIKSVSEILEMENTKMDKCLEYFN